jgi:hypothetical protein
LPSRELPLDRKASLDYEEPDFNLSRQQHVERFTVTVEQIARPLVASYSEVSIRPERPGEKDMALADTSYPKRREIFQRRRRLQQKKEGKISKAAEKPHPTKRPYDYIPDLFMLHIFCLIRHIKLLSNS